MKIDSGARTTATFNAANQVVTEKDGTGTTTYTHDADGNQTLRVAPGGGRTTMTWDYENKLTRVLLPGGTRNTMLYDGDGKRVRKDDSSGTAKFVWDQENVLLETDGVDAVQATYTLQPLEYGNLLASLRGATKRYYHFDGLGSADRLTDELRAVKDSYLYAAFGSIIASTGSSTNPFRFVGRLGYYYEGDLLTHSVRARYYSPSLGRFLSPDPLSQMRFGESSCLSRLDGLPGALDGAPCSLWAGFPRFASHFGVQLRPGLGQRLVAFAAGDWNLYRYALNRPVLVTDASGLDSVQLRIGVLYAEGGMEAVASLLAILLGISVAEVLRRIPNIEVARDVARFAEAGKTTEEAIATARALDAFAKGGTIAVAKEIAEAARRVRPPRMDYCSRYRCYPREDRRVCIRGVCPIGCRCDPSLYDQQGYIQQCACHR